MKVFQFKFPTMVVDKASGERVMFDPASNADHRRKLDENIDQWRRQHPEAHDAQLDTSVNREGSQQIVNLRPADQKPAAGERIARIWEARLGMKMVRFEPYEGRAVFEALDKDRVSARGILANALGVKPWDVMVEPRDGGGWRCRLARTIIWQPSKMAARTQEACEQIGHVGWTYTADAKTGIIDIIRTTCSRRSWRNNRC